MEPTLEGHTETPQIKSFAGRYRFLSNFYPAKIEYQGRVFYTVEHAYQASKTHNEQDIDAIASAETPGKAKRMGRKVKLRANWNESRVRIMKELLLLKFSTTELRYRLLDTGDAELIEENNWNDRFWGVCKGVGENMLGKLLMEVRTELRGQEDPLGQKNPPSSSHTRKGNIYHEDN
jgi:N-glycosidase YbiA